MTAMSDLLPSDLPAGSPLARRAAIVSCWLCGIRLHHSQMVPDGDNACHDIRWYCQDTQTCTERWTSARHQRRAAEAAEAAAPGSAPAGSSAPAEPVAAGSAILPSSRKGRAKLPVDRGAPHQ